MKIDIEVLRAAIDRLLDHAKQMRGPTIEIDPDLYWFVPNEELTDPTTEPSGLTLGSLEDDWSAVSAVGVGTKEPIGYALVWASTLLRALGDGTP